MLFCCCCCCYNLWASLCFYFPCVYFSVYMYGWKFVYKSVCRSAYLSVSAFLFLSVCLSVCLSVFLPLTHPLSTQDRLVGLVVKASASRAEGPGFESRLRGIFSGSSHTSDLKIGTPVATLPGAWRYRVSTGTGRPGVSIL